MLPELAIAAVGSHVGDRITDKKHELDAPTTTEELLIEACELLRHIASFFNATEDVKQDLYEIVRLVKNNSWKVETKRYKRLFMFVPVSTTITMSISGLGNFDYTPSIGWNRILFPDETLFTLSSSNATPTQNILLRYTEENV